MFILFAITQNVGATSQDPTRVFLSGEERVWEQEWLSWSSSKTQNNFSSF